jgi:imidazolonepropionase-like amidohydrolase
MQFICDAAGQKTWFRIETEAEAARESELMRHAVEKHFQRAYEEASQSYRPAPGPTFEQDIGRGAHIQRAMPRFLTLRDGEGNALATAMLPRAGRDGPVASPIVVGPANSDPYPAHGNAIEALGRHFGLTLDRARCYPYRRG